MLQLTLAATTILMYCTSISWRSALGSYTREGSAEGLQDTVALYPCRMLGIAYILVSCVDHRNEASLGRPAYHDSENLQVYRVCSALAPPTMPKGLWLGVKLLA